MDQSVFFTNIIIKCTRQKVEQRVAYMKDSEAA